MYPVGLNLDRAVTLLQEYDVGHDLCSGVCLESIVRQADSTEQFSPLSDILTDFGRLLIHRVAGCDERDNSAGSNLIECFRYKVVVYGKVQLVVRLVVHFVVSERHVANSQIKKVPPVSRLKPCHGNVRFRVQLLRDSACDAVQLHAVELAVLHRFRQKSKEVADAH